MLSGHFRFTVFLHLKWIILLACFWMQLPTPGFAQPAANPDAATQLFQEASRLQNAGKFEAALAKWRQFIAKHADDAAVGQAYGGLGTCLLETGKPAEAIEAFNQTLNRLPKGESG